MSEPELSPFLKSLVLNRSDIVSSVVSILASKLHSYSFTIPQLEDTLASCMYNDPNIKLCLEQDIDQYLKKDPACLAYSTPLLFYKGFQSIAAYRAANRLWTLNRKNMAVYIQSLCSEIFSVDIHPGADIAGGVMIDHATSVVIGETCIIETGVALYQGVTLGGRGHDTGKRHPHIKKHATIFASSSVLGNITVGENSIVAAGSLVLNDVENNTTVAGIPAKGIHSTENKGDSHD